MKRMSLISSAALILVLALAGCSRQAAPGSVARAESDVVVTATAAPAATPTHASPATPGPTASPTPSPTLTATVAPTETPTPASMPAPQRFRLTDGGCCTQPFWSPAGDEVRFIDRPPDDTRLGIWGASIARPGAPEFVTERLEESLAAGGFLVTTTENTTAIERLSDGERWAVPARGRSVRISLGLTRIAWTEGNEDLPPDRQVTAVWIANLDGSEPRKVVMLRRGGLSGWISDEVLLVNGRESATATDQVLWALPLDGSPHVELARAERLRGPLLSPSGAWVAYYVTFDADPARNGLWVARTDGGGAKQLPHELFGSYQWRGCPGACDPDGESLLVVPLQPEAELHELWQFHAESGEAQRLTDPAVTPFKIANGDWRVSPDGRHIAYVESSDRSIWAITLP
jgi:hypothetical protein